jgi:hypothetical protein
VERAQPGGIAPGVEGVVGRLVRERDARLEGLEHDRVVLRAVAERHGLEERRVERVLVAVAEPRRRPQRAVRPARDGERLARGVGQHAVEVEDEELHRARPG